MTEFYSNLSNKEVQAIINKKLEIYDPQTTLWEINGDIVLQYDNIIYTSYAKFHGLTIGSFEMHRYLGVHQGTEFYHFYVIRPKMSEEDHVIGALSNKRTQRKMDK